MSVSRGIVREVGWIGEGTMSAPNARSWGPEEGLDPRFDCPDCDYERTGTTTSRHKYELHLMQVHDYDVDEVRHL